MPPTPASRGIFFNLDARRELLMPILFPKSHVLQFLAYRILIVAARTLCEVAISNCT